MVELHFFAVLTEPVCGKMCLVTYQRVQLSCSLNSCMRFAYLSVQGDLPGHVTPSFVTSYEFRRKRPAYTRYILVPMWAPRCSSPPSDSGVPRLGYLYGDSSSASFRTKSIAQHHCGGWQSLERGLAWHSRPDDVQRLCTCRSGRMIRT